MTDVTVFFRDTNKWRSPGHDHDNESKDSTPALSEIISDRDVTNLFDLSMCILHIKKKAQDEQMKTTYDNVALDDFMDELALMIDEISRKKNIKDYISQAVGTRFFGIDVPVKY